MSGWQKKNRPAQNKAKPNLAAISIDEDAEFGAPNSTTSLPLLDANNKERETAVDGAQTEFIKLNIGGSHYCIPADKIVNTEADSYLANFVQLSVEDRMLHANAYFSDTNEYYFARSPRIFESVFNYYVNGVLHMPADICPNLFLTELRFWNIPYKEVAQCCHTNIIFNEDKAEGAKNSLRRQFEGLCCASLRYTTWQVVEYPSTSIFAKLFMLTSMFFVFLSVLIVIMASIPDFLIDVPVNSTNLTLVEEISYEKVQNPVFDHLETVCVLWFTFELTVRFLVSPRKGAFFKDTLNIIDILAIAPFYLELGLLICNVTAGDLRNIKGAFLVVRILRVLRVIRVLKIARYFAGLRKFALVLSYSAGQLGMTGMLVMVGLIFFSTLVYFVEKDVEDTPFPSIPAAMWWCLVTMTTVGYGDIVPISIGGKFVGSLAIICGVFVLALPITIMVENFTKFLEEPEDADK